MSAGVLSKPDAERAGERFEALYRECAGELFAYVASVLRDRHAAEDVTALAFERAFRRRRLFDARRGSERAWLFGIARNAALDELRRRGRSGPLIGEVIDTNPVIGPDDDLAERRALVREALAGLDAQDREVVLLKFVGRLSNGELARVLRCSETAAGTRLHRAIVRLREACDVPQ
ncbi:MAG: sigma-70 family RNA polymerase sigma factor [Solirubrobacteraceae bacterium]